ncbi:TetR/AcrR family transcriptional regulator [Hydrogenimonas urashimensis]|uniref:TetR/AcrR family transcriptional regulator n=1 Tax=Hydrogenimonas urashimensis TaxID=2740515 RepID=UPI001914EFE1|nr:TetR/AcrR family transcriptional regulator [Hydrogenimonas urashimensis]
MKSSTKEERRLQILSGALKLFAQKGFHATTIPDIARHIGMSVGNFYNYFPSKEILAQEILRYISAYLGKRIRKINESALSSREKIRGIVETYFETAQNEPEMIDFFLRVYLSNREVFGEGCEGMICVNEFVTEIMIFFDDGVARGELKNQDFFSAFGLFMGYLGGMVFLAGESILPKPMEAYIDDISMNIYNALKVA